MSCCFPGKRESYFASGGVGEVHHVPMSVVQVVLGCTALRLGDQVKAPEEGRSWYRCPWWKQDCAWEHAASADHPGSL